MILTVGGQATSVQIMNQSAKNSTLGFNGMGSGLETYKSLGDVFGIQAAVESMKTATTYANHDAVTCMAPNGKGNAVRQNLTQARNIKINDKLSNGGMYSLLNIIC